MRTFQALAIVLCVFGAIHLLQGPTFFWPDRFDPSRGVLLGGLSSRLLGGGRPAPRRWQRRYFLLVVLALGLVSAAFTTGERGPNPDWRAPPGERAQPT
ncbi:hypothetical protein [Aromatoleum aromaticum]|uniref:hypothetical protein n=1 Tax=Aromatoleum aromaticum TaxID=551760 RepID=UPI001459A177|nr:hypothetical protein [Aromatoleum aromaticum]NMG53405.1 hypothetical protein [Aromatoleum aromaticum]